MPKLQPTKQTLLLAEALKAKGVEFELEYWDGHKHIDIYIPKAKIAIEIDGLQHYLDPKQVSADFNRDYYSNKEEIFTKRFPNTITEEHTGEIAEMILGLVNKKKYE
jgi:very-short-patch-repair endonuclease